MNNYIKWCPKCKGRILTTGQIRDNLLCEECQKEHIKKYHNKFNMKNNKEVISDD